MRLLAASALPLGGLLSARTVPRTDPTHEGSDVDHTGRFDVCGHDAIPEQVRVRTEDLDVAGGRRTDDDRRSGRFVLLRPARLTEADYRRYGGRGRWFDFGTRHFDPARYRRVDDEVQRIIGALLTLNRTGLYSAGFDYRSILGCLDIEIFDGTEKLLSEPIYRICLDCRYDPIYDAETGEEFSSERFIEWLTLLVQ